MSRQNTSYIYIKKIIITQTDGIRKNAKTSCPSCTNKLESGGGFVESGKPGTSQCGSSQLPSELLPSGSGLSLEKGSLTQSLGVE